MNSHLKHQKGPTGKVETDNPFYGLVQEAYRVFKQAPTEHGVCECCMYPEIRRDFFSHKQAALPLSYIQDWFFAAADIPLDQAAWRFVLPRIMEVLASSEDPATVALEVSLSRFETGNPKNWSSEEWTVLDKFQKLFLFQTDLRPDECLDDTLCMFASAGWSTEDLFSQVLNLPSDRLVTKLWSDWCKYHRPSIWITPFWEDESIPRKFYCSEELIEKVSNFALDDTTPPELAKKAIAISDLIAA